MAVTTLLTAGCTFVAPLGDLTSGSVAGPGGDAMDDGAPDSAFDGAARDSTVGEAATDASLGEDAEAGASGDAADASADAVTAADADAGITYEGAVLADSPLAYWRVDETTGTTAQDLSGNGNDAQYVGGVTLGAPGALIGDPDLAVTLDGTTGYIDAGDRFAFTANAPFTLEIWAKPAIYAQNYPRLMARETDASPRSGYLLFVRQGNMDPITFSLERWSNGTQENCPDTQPIALAWHHLVGTYDGATSRVYLDGVAVGAQPSSGSIPTFPGSFLVGKSAFDANMFTGSVDEMAVYGAALTAARVATHYHASGR